MEANAFWVILALLAVVAAALMRRRRAIGEDADAPEARATSRYHCVAVKSGVGACEQARRIRGRRHLSAEAPPIPLTGCSAKRCSCVYVHFDDRRQASRRHAHHPYLADPGHVDRRSVSGRRKSDLRMAHPSH